MLKPLRHAGLLAALALFGGTPQEARSDEVSDIASLMVAARQQVGRAQSEDSLGERARAILEIGNASINAGQALDLTSHEVVLDALGVRRARALAKRIARLRRTLDDAALAFADITLPLDRATKLVKRARRQADGLTRSVSRLPMPGVTLMERNARAAGFHKAGKTVRFRVRARGPDGRPCDPAQDAPIVTAANAGAAQAVVPGQYTPDAKGNVEIPLGPDFGGANVSVSYCGYSAIVVIFNKGPRPQKADGDGGTGTAPGGRTLITGSWSGSFNVSQPQDCSGFSGAWSATIVEKPNGKLTGSWTSSAGFGGTLRGRISPGGLANWQGSGGRVTFQGLVRNGSISGNFTAGECDFGPGLVRGSFSGGGGAAQ